MKANPEMTSSQSSASSVPFLQLVAHDLYAKVGGDLSHTVLVFPNKRASLFFNEYLAAESDKPIWSPVYLSISDLFNQLSDVKLGDPIRLVCLLYRAFCEKTDSRETLDEFYSWGELLISDFDDVDKNLVDASRLFSNLQDLHDISDQYGFLDAGQEAAIRQFFQNFSLEKRTKLKERFLSLWNRLEAVYLRYQELLLQAGIAYEGMLYRRVMERLDVSALPDDRYVFVGFNVLNKVETAFFRQLQEAGKAWFYWDYDIFYTRLPREKEVPYMHEAGEFILRNLKEFPNQLPESLFDVMRHPKQVSFIASPTENAQARYLSEALASFDVSKEASKADTAVVLCNEALLLPVIHSIPPTIRNVNITMGFPLAQTPAYSFVNALLTLQTTGYRPKEGYYVYEAVNVVLRHPYVRSLSAQAEALERRLTESNRFYPFPSELKADDFLGKVFVPQQSPAALCGYLSALLRDVTAIYRKEEEEKDIFSQLYREALFKCYTYVNRLQNLIEKEELTLQTVTLTRLLARLMTSANIPFHGEPVLGLQVMGVLETRNLDFRNLIILSLNEGQLPKSGGEVSFIPYNLRKAFGMTTIDHKNAVYAYYFYRLMQRAEKVALAYNTSSEGLSKGEMSRFMLQFHVEWPHEISFRYLEAGQAPQHGREISILKTPRLLQQMYERYDTRIHPKALFSPSALNAYLDCRLKFYFHYLAGLSAPDEVSAEIDSALFGTLFHRSAELVYADLTLHGKEVRPEDIKRLLDQPAKVREYVNLAFKEKFFHVEKDEKPVYNGTQLIHAEVITSYLRQLLRIDMDYAPFFLEHTEYKVSETVYIDTPQGRLPISIGGTIDRIDRKGDTLRIIDYKTGGKPKTVECLEELFTPADDRPNYVFQTFLYAAIMSRQQALSVAPSLLYIHKAASEGYSPVIEMGAPRAKVPVTDFSDLESEFRQRLQALLQEIFDPDEPFEQTGREQPCEYCDFRKLCKR